MLNVVELSNSFLDCFVSVFFEELVVECIEEKWFRDSVLFGERTWI